MTVQREDFFVPEAILEEIERAIEQQKGAIDFVTFVGEGEPTLCKSLGRLIEKTKEIVDIPVAVDTNGSLLYRSDVRAELQSADVVMPSLDAGTPRTFHKINRPHRELDFETIVRGISEFSRRYEGEIWMEVMLVKGINDVEEELEALRYQLERIEPERTYLNVPIRPPAESWAVPPDEEAIELALAVLSDLNVRDITGEERGEFSVAGFESPEEAIMALIRRHPMRETQVIETLNRMGYVNIPDSLKRLRECGKIKRVRYRGKVFWLSC